VANLQAKFEVSMLQPFSKYGGGCKISKVSHVIPSRTILF